MSHWRLLTYIHCIIIIMQCTCLNPLWTSLCSSGKTMASPTNPHKHLNQSRSRCNSFRDGRILLLTVTQHQATNLTLRIALNTIVTPALLYTLSSASNISLYSTTYTATEEIVYQDSTISPQRCKMLQFKLHADLCHIAVCKHDIRLFLHVCHIFAYHLKCFINKHL